MIERTTRDSILEAADQLFYLQQYFDDGVFLMVGGLQPSLGGGVLVHALSLTEIRKRIAAAPFVVERIVTAEIVEITPARVDARLKEIFG